MIVRPKQEIRKKGGVRKGTTIFTEVKNSEPVFRLHIKNKENQEKSSQNMHRLSFELGIL